MKKALIVLLTLALAVVTLSVSLSQADERPKLAWTMQEHKHSVRALALSPDKDTVASTCGDLICLSSLSKRKVLHKFPEEKGRTARSMTFSPDGKRLIVASDRRTLFGSEPKGPAYVLYWYDLEAKRRVHSLEFKEGGVGNLALSPDGKLLVCCTSVREKECPLTLRDPATGKVLKEIKLEAWCNAFAFTPDGKQVVTLAHGNDAVLWEVATGKRIRSFRLGETRGGPTAAAVSADGKCLVVANSQNLFFFDLATAELRAKTKEWPGCGDLNCLTFARSGRWLISVEPGGVPRVVDGRGGRHLFRFYAHLGGVRSIVTVSSADGEWLVTGGGDQAMKVWRLEEDKEKDAQK